MQSALQMTEIGRFFPVRERKRARSAQAQPFAIPQNDGRINRERQFVNRQNKIQYVWCGRTGNSCLKGCSSALTRRCGIESKRTVRAQERRARIVIDLELHTQTAFTIEDVLLRSASVCLFTVTTENGGDPPRAK